MADPRDSRPAYDDPAAARLNAPAAERNAGPIAEALARRLGPTGGDVLEVGAGTGQHAVACARALTGRRWRPTDPDPVHLASIAAWSSEAGLSNLAPARRLDATRAADWSAAEEDGPAAAVYASNVIHISPWAVAEGLVSGAARLLAPGGRLLLYGPFLDGDATSESNRAFDAALRLRDPSWGVRTLDEVVALAARHGFGPPEREAMPANNLLLDFPLLDR